MNLIEEKVLYTIKKYSMINKGEKILLAVSGGYDSTVLCLILDKLSKILDISLAIAHLNHSIRGKESDEDEKFVVNLGKKFNIPVVTEKINIPELKSKERIFSIEEIARRERYNFLKRTASKIKADKIATGHTADDQVENFFLSAFNGRGTSALAGIPPVYQNIIRPLIECTREEIQNYLSSCGINAHLDSSNLDTSIPRNWIRYKLLPFIQKNFKPVKSSILKSMDILREEDYFLKKISEKIFKNTIFNVRSVYRIIFPFKLRNLEIALIRRILKEVFAALGKEKYTYSEINFMTERIRQGMQNIKLNDIIYFYYNNYTIFTLANELKTYSFSIMPGERKEISFLNIKIICEIDNKIDKFEPNAIYLNTSENRPIIIRSRKKGDKIQLMNTDYSISLKKLFIDLKIPQSLRKVLPIIEIENEIAGLYLNIFPLNLKNRISERYKILDKRKKFVKLYFEEIK